jgi:hypothetical protein
VTIRDRVAKLVREAYDLGTESQRLQTNEDPRISIMILVDEIMRFCDCTCTCSVESYHCPVHWEE